MEKQMGSQSRLLLVLFLPLSIFHSLSNPNQFYNRVYLLSVCLQKLSCLDKRSSTHNPTSNQFNQSKHYTMKKACRKTTNHPFSIWHNGKKLSFLGHFTYALNGWFLTEITLANNFEKFSFVTISTKLQSSLKKKYEPWFFYYVRSRKVFTKLFQYNDGRFKWDALRDLLPFVHFKNRKNTHGGALLLVKLQ